MLNDKQSNNDDNDGGSGHITTPSSHRRQVATNPVSADSNSDLTKASMLESASDIKGKDFDNKAYAENTSSFNTAYINKHQRSADII